MTDRQAVDLFDRCLPAEALPADVEQRLTARIAPALRGLATGRVDPTTRQIVITPCDPDGLDLAGAWGFEDGINGNPPAGALHFHGQALDAYNDAYSRGAQMRTRFWGG